MQLWKVIWNIGGYQVEEVFNDYRDARYFADDREMLGAQCVIVEI